MKLPFAASNIALLGRGRAILDGGSYNGLSKKNSERDGLPDMPDDIDNITVRNIRTAACRADR